MSDTVSFGVTIHGAPASVSVYEGGSSLDVLFTEGLYPHVVMHCGSPALASDLAAAINAVLARHRDLAGANGRPEGGA